MTSVLTAGFLLAGSSYAVAVPASAGATSAGQTSTAGLASCPAQWTADGSPVPPAPAPSTGSSAVTSLAVLSPTDVWMLAGPDVYHLAGGAWEMLASPAGAGLSIVANSDTDVWVADGYVYGAETDTWHYDGSTWTKHALPASLGAQPRAAALGPDGTLYLAGANGTTGEGGVWSFDGTQWADVTPANPPSMYNTLAVTADGTLIAGGWGSEGGKWESLQERSGTTWATIPLLPMAVNVRDISVAPGGTVYAVGSDSGSEAVLIELPPGSHSAVVRDIPTPVLPRMDTGVAAVVAVGPGDVWVLGSQSLPGLTGRLWITHFDGSRFVAAGTPDFSTLGEYFALVGAVSLGPDVLAFGDLGVPDGPFSPKLLAVCPAQVTGRSIVPRDERTTVGSQMFWSVPAAAASRHELVAPEFFDSGPVEPGGFFAYGYFAAATYAIRDTGTGATQTVRVSPVATPPSGATSTVYTITCATVQAPAGYAYRVLIRRPGSPGYTLLTTTGQPATTFLPYQGTGTYRFECQVQTPAGMTAASPPAAVSVSLRITGQARTRGGLIAEISPKKGFCNSQKQFLAGFPRAKQAVIATLFSIGNHWSFSVRTLRTSNAISVAADGFGTGGRVPADRPFGADGHQRKQPDRKSCRQHVPFLPQPLARRSIPVFRGVTPGRP